MRKFTYKHKVQYYETDKMGIVHHSNYIRWMEEARSFMMEEIGFGFDKMEELGIGSPVLSVECSYKKPTTYGDTVEIDVFLSKTGGVRFSVGYEMRIEGSEEVCTVGETSHCFMNSKGRIVLLKRELPEVDAIFSSALGY